MNREKPCFDDFLHLLECPVCRTRFSKQKNSIICTSNHCFDIAKKGYINFLSKQPVTKYNKELSAARRQVFDNGFFRPLLDRITEQIISIKANRITILDAGCGEGSNLLYIIKRLSEEQMIDLLAMGSDISKEAIQSVGKKSINALFCVADIANMPFGQTQFDIILNILAPANYSEFNRYLKPGGSLIKVVPSDHYLQELRSIVYTDKKKQNYSNAQVIELFKRHFETFRVEEINYTQTVTQEYLEKIIHMTPLVWNEDKRALVEKCRHIDQITVGFSVLTGIRSN